MDEIKRLACRESAHPARYVRALVAEMVLNSTWHLVIKPGVPLPEVPAHGEHLNPTTHDEVDYRLRQLCSIGDYRFESTEGEVSGVFGMRFKEGPPNKISAVYRVDVVICDRGPERRIEITVHPPGPGVLSELGRPLKALESEAEEDWPDNK